MRNELEAPGSTAGTRPRCAASGCTARPYGVNGGLGLGIDTCKAHTPCSEPGCRRMVGRHGCAPAALGRPLCKSHYSRWGLYGSTAEHQRKERSDKGSYRVPERVEGSIAGHPELSRMFVRNLDIPGRGPRELGLSVGNRCEWRCLRDQTHPNFVAAPNALTSARPTSRTRADGTTYVYQPDSSSLGCPACAARTRTMSRRRSLLSRLAIERPELVGQFVANVTTPENDLRVLQPRSRDLVRWRCGCGELVDRKPEKIPAGSVVFCTACKRVGESLLEWHVQALLQEASGLRVDRQHRVMGWSVDLHFPELGWLVDLDPHYTHGTEARLRTDIRKTRALSDATYLRVREAPLEPIGTRDLRIPAGSRAGDFATALLEEIATTGRPIRPVTGGLVARTLAAVQSDWSRQPRPRLVDAHPGRVALVLACVDDPGLDWAAAPLAAIRHLRFLVRCPTPGHRPRTVVMRNWLGNLGTCANCTRAVRSQAAETQ